MARPDDHDVDNSPERDWDRNISGVLAELRPPAAEAAPPTLDPVQDFTEAFDTAAAGVYRAGRSERPWKTRGRLLFMGLVTVLGCGLVLVALWPRVVPDAAGAPVAAPTVGAETAPAAGVDALQKALRAERARTLRLEARVDALTGRLDAFEAERASAVGRVDALERALAEQARRAAAAPALAPAAPSALPPAPAGSAAAASGPVVASSPGAAGGWTVSLMTLSARATAEAYAQEVRAGGWPAEVMETGTRGGLWRVSSGRFGARADAEAHATSIAEVLDLDSVWVTRRTGR